MAKLATPKSEFDIDEAGAAIAARFDALPWNEFSDLNRPKRDAVRFEVQAIQRDLMKVGAIDMPKAASIWDAHVPTFVPRPLAFSDPEPLPIAANMIEPGRRKRRPSREPWLDPEADVVEKVDARPTVEPAADAEAQTQTQTTVAPVEQDTDPKAARHRMLLEGLEKQYLKADDRYHFRDRSGEVAFEAQTKRLVTAHEAPAIVSSMIDLAEARGWKTLKLSGTDDFRREAWLQASLRQIDVTGYRPTKLDKARLEEMRTEFGDQRAGKNIIAHRDPSADSQPYEPANAPKSEQTPELTQGQTAVLDALEKTMRARGDSDQAIAAARDLAAVKLGKGRVHVGKLVETGMAPYQDKAGEPQSHYLVLEDDAGRQQKVWGADLPRAVEEGEVAKGDKIALAFRGRQPVTVNVKVPNEDGQGTRLEKREVERNAWEAVKFDVLRQATREKVTDVVKRDFRPANNRLASPTQNAPRRGRQKEIAR